MVDTNADESDEATPAGKSGDQADPKPVVEIGGRGGLDPTRYGDWVKGGRAIDF